MQELTIGVLGLQGDYEAHAKMLRQGLGINTMVVRTAAELAEAHGLVIPGGESTTIGKLIVKHDLDEPLRARIAAGMPVYGTCAGLILLAVEVEGMDQYRLGVLNVAVARNAFGRQVDSFETDIPMAEIGADTVRGVFIRAPYVTRLGEGVRELARYNDRVVAVRQANILGTAFHPELTTDTRTHAYFVQMVKQSLE